MSKIAMDTTKRIVTKEYAKAGFRQAIVSEWTKLISVRSTVWTTAFMMAAILGIAVFVGATESLQPDDTVLGGGLTGAGQGLIAAAIIGVLSISGEYGSGLIRTTFTANPRRVTVLAAKGAVIAASMFVVALVTCFLAYEIGNVMLSGKGYAPGEPMPALFGLALFFSVIGVLGLAIGAMLRHSAGAITTIFGIVLVPSLIGPLFGDLERWIVGGSPLVALQKMAQSSDAASEVAGSLGAWPSVGMVGAYSTVALIAAAVVIKRRDA